MTFASEGFLSPMMECFRTSLREIPAYRLWLTFADELNRLGWEMVDSHKLPAVDTENVMTSVLFVSAHQSFQAAIMLIERGLLGDARVVLRSAVEGTIALNVLADDTSFGIQLMEADLHNRRKAARLALNTPGYRSSYSADQIRQLEATIQDVTDREASVGREFGDITHWSVI